MNFKKVKHEIILKILVTLFLFEFLLQLGILSDELATSPDLIIGNMFWSYLQVTLLVITFLLLFTNLINLKVNSKRIEKINNIISIPTMFLNIVIFSNVFYTFFIKQPIIVLLDMSTVQISPEMYFGNLITIIGFFVVFILMFI